MSRVLLGKLPGTRELVCIDDIARRSGCYVLGKMGMGKSALSIFMAMQDIAHGHGVFFLDPHGDAGFDLIRRGNAEILKKNAYLLDPADEEYSFGINLLQCGNVASLTARMATYTRAYNVFEKIWEDTWGVWLQLILQNILHAFIENQDYTLADVPMFLNPRNVEFRNHIIDNIKHEPQVADFWRYEFFERREPNQQERFDAALTRINTLLTHRYVRDIVGQQRTTIDFARVLASKQIILLKLSANLPEDVKKFLGTILLSEFVFALRDRPEDARTQFCIFVDEFHNFASTDHMATMVTEGRKFGVAPTFIHVERFGQLAHNQKLLGATQAIANKVFFQTIVKDAEEFAPEFAKEVEPTEKRREPELVISPRPVEDIWDKGHPNKWISYARQQYLWVVDLLRKHTNDAYIPFDSVRIPPYDPKFFSLTYPTWDEFDDWELYRITPQMLETGISLLNRYYYECMQGKYSRKKPVTDAEIELALQVVECFAGVFGLRPTMIPYIPDTMRLMLVKRVQEIRERELENEHRQDDELRRLGLEDRIPRFSGAMPAIALDEVPTHLFLQNVPLWQKNAITAGFSTHEIDQFIQWQVRPYVHFERERLCALIEDVLNNGCDNPTLYHQYHGIMLHEIFERKNIDPDPLDENSPIMQKYGGRIIWQRGAIQALTCILFTIVPSFLLKQPVKIPSSKYDESLRVERPQHDLVTDMVLELSRLPRYQAYAKIIAGEDDVQSVQMHRIQTLPLPAIKENAAEVEAAVIENGHRLSKRRDEIEVEIRERQSRWGRGGGAPPTRQPH